MACVVAAASLRADWDGVPPDTAPWWYQLYLGILWIGLPLYVLDGWITRRLRDRHAWKKWQRSQAADAHSE